MADLLRPDAQVITQEAGRRLWKAADEWGDRVKLFSTAREIALQGLGLAVAHIRVESAEPVENVTIEIVALGE